jgi:hypothetical protein
VDAALVVTVLLALGGYWFTRWNSLRLAQRTARLERVERQLREFYGPLFANVAAARMGWQSYQHRVNPEAYGTSWPNEEPPPEEQAAWRLWMTEVFMPLNLEMERVVVEKSDLLEESEMPPSLLQLCAHVEAYKTVIKRWENHDFSEHTSVIDFPAREVAEYVGTRFSVLKDEQMRLLGLLKKGAR